jgi:hypothetical protein
MRARSRLLPFIAFFAMAAACGGDDDDDVSDGDVDAGVDADVSPWEVAQQDLPGALLSVWGTSASDIWAVGSSTGEGPLVLHYDGSTWDEVDTSAVGDVDFWWVFGFEDGPVYMGGSGGTIVSYEAGALTTMSTPTNALTVFGIWGCSPDDVWAVGGQEGGNQGGFAWRLDGDAWVEAEGFPTEVSAADAVWKMYGRSCTDAWMVGTAGLAIHWDGNAFSPVERVAGNSLFTVHANSERFVAVGGFSTEPTIVENADGTWVDVSPSGGDAPVGVCLTEEGGFASGFLGSMRTRSGGEWALEDTGIFLDQTLHSVWVDQDGGVWAAGGQVLIRPYDQGVLLHRAN